MATQLDRTDSDSTIIGASDLYPDKHACALSTQRNATTIEWSRHQLWVGYMLSSQFWLDILELSGSTERHLRDLCSWWEVRVPKWHRMKNRMLFCKRPIVVIGTLPQISREAFQTQKLPHETLFSTLEKSDFLTRGFHNPASLVDDPDYFDRYPGFAVIHEGQATMMDRKVLVVAWEVDKRLLAYPFFASLALGALVSVAVVVSTQCIATGAQVGGSLCGVIAAVFCYIVWRCN